MKIELRKLKIARALSEETLAYTAEIWIDGKLAFHAKNQGCGGPDMYYKMGDVTEAEVDAYAKATLDPIVFGDITLEPDMETLVGNLIARWEASKKLDRMLKNKVVLIDGQDNVYTVKAEPTPQNCDRILAKNAGCVIVNNPSPELRERVLVALGADA